MGKVTVYQYAVLDTNVLERRVARRWGTREAIERLKRADLIEDSAVLVDETILNEGGFTPLDFDPLKRPTRRQNSSRRAAAA
jgi:hypothetical protein